MPDASTFNTDTGEPCKCVSQSKTGWGVQSLLLLIGLSVLAGVAYLLTQLMSPQNAALPPTAPVSKSSFASPSPSTAVPSPTATLNPLIEPTYMTVFVTTPTPSPTATMTPREARAEADKATKIAAAMPPACPEATVTPGTPVLCYWPTPRPSPQPTPNYQTCSTPVPAQYCLKKET